MQNLNDPQFISSHDGEIDLMELFNIIFNSKWIISLITVGFSIMAIIYSLALPNIYESKTLLYPNTLNDEKNSTNNYANLTSILGGTTSTSQDNSVQAIKKIETLSFFESNILPNIYLPNLMALESWNQTNNTINLNNKIYDDVSEQWIRKSSNIKHAIPSSQESYKKFKEHLTVRQDIKTGFVTISVKHQSPYIAKKWTALIVDEINAFYRQKDKIKAQTAVNYLNKQMVNTNFSELKQVIASLLQEETKKLTLIEANEFYVYEFVDPPVVMEKKSEPQRLTIIMIGTMLGAILGILYSIIMHYNSKKKLP